MTDLEQQVDRLGESVNQALALWAKARSDRELLFAALKFISEISTDEKVLTVIQATLKELQ